MPDEGIRTQVGLQGDKEYKQGLSDISRQLTVLNTDMKASQSAFGDQAGSMEALRDKLSKLGAIYETQQKKVQLIAQQLEKAKTQYGENSVQADRLKIALNKATEQLNKTNNEITATEGSLQELNDAQDEAGDAASDAGKAIESEAREAKTPRASTTSCTTCCRRSGTWRAGC